MEPNSPVDKSREIEVLESQIRECYSRVVYSHKVHEKCADIYLKRYNLIKYCQIVLSAIISGGLLISLLGNNKASAIMATVLSILLLIVNSYMKVYDLSNLSQKQADTACMLWNIRESYLSTLTDIATGDFSIEDIRKTRNQLQEYLSMIYQNAPRTLNKAYKLAEEALTVNKEMTFSDDEIDKFLPSHLRISKKKVISKQPV